MRTRDFNEIIGFKTPAKVRAEITGISYYHLHSHSNCTELICVLNGHVSVYDFAIEYKLSPGEIHIANSGDPHKIVSDDPDSLILILQFEKDHYASYYDNLDIAYWVSHTLDPSGVNCAEMRYLRMLMAKIYEEYNKYEPSDIALEGLTRELITLLFDYFHDYAYAKANTGYIMIRKRNHGQDENIFNRVYRVADYIESNYYKKLSLDEIAQAEFINPAYLSRYIKQNIGVTFSELVSIARCSEAERLLTATNMTVEQIAVDTGFSNRSHMTTQYRKWYGMTPAQYRKQVAYDYSNNHMIIYHDFDAGTAENIIQGYLNG